MQWLAILLLYLQDIRFWNGYVVIKMTRKRMANYFSCSVQDKEKHEKIVAKIREFAKVTDEIVRILTEGIA